MQGVGAGNWGWGVYVYIRILCIRCMNYFTHSLFNVVLYMYCCAYMDSVIEMQRRKSRFIYSRATSNNQNANRNTK